MRVIRMFVAVGMLLLMSSPPALADSEVTRHGHGSLGSHWELQLDREHAIEVEFDVHSSHANHTWRVVMRHNGDVFFRGTRTTDGEGDFDIERVVGDRAGTDTIRVRAVDQKNGETVKAVASI